jgi:hypothetical protein
MGKPRVMYMHTLDGKPACFDMLPQRGGAIPYIYFAGGRHAVKLVPTLRQIRREQQATVASEWREWTARNPEFRGERPSIKRYGYVLVSVASREASLATGER